MIIFLGAAVFSGLRNTPYTMAASADAYLNSHNYADLTYIATLGFSDEDVAKVRKLKGVKKVVPCYQFDALFAHKDGKSGVTVYSQEKYEKSMLDRPELLKRMNVLLMSILVNIITSWDIQLNFLMIMVQRHIRL